MPVGVNVNDNKLLERSVGDLAKTTRTASTGVARYTERCFSWSTAVAAAQTLFDPRKGQAPGLRLGSLNRRGLRGFLGGFGGLGRTVLMQGGHEGLGMVGRKRSISEINMRTPVAAELVLPNRDRRSVSTPPAEIAAQKILGAEPGS